jgi:imidazole glycerol phosphate synthase subunit HisF
VIIPCIDLMGGKVVQLVQGREKALEVDDPLEVLRKFASFPEIQVIDLDAAIGSGSNDALVELLAQRAKCRIGGGVRSAERARTLVDQGAHKVIIGTAAFNRPVLDSRGSWKGSAHHRARFQRWARRSRRVARIDFGYRRRHDSRIRAILLRVPLHLRR